jgi:hypothetical protein
MYKVKPVSERVSLENLPTTMYKVKSYFQPSNVNFSFFFTLKIIYLHSNKISYRFTIF